MKTWQLEFAVVAGVLTLVCVATKSAPVEWLGAVAVLATFGHAQVADRMAAEQAAQVSPSVHCYRWSLRYYVAKEALWLVYFAMHRSWSALVGVGVFLVYPVWCRYWAGRKA